MSQPSILQMSQIQENTFKRALTLLDSMKCVYLIIDPLGNKHGILEIKEQSTRASSKFPHGERVAYVRQYTENMMIGNVVEIPFDKYDASAIQTSACSCMFRKWGVGSVTTTINRPKKVVEVMRIL